MSNLMDKLPAWIRTNRYLHQDQLGPSNTSEDKHKKPPVLTEVGIEKANLISSYSYTKNGVEYHRPLLDIDMNAALLPSSTSGHFHLYIDKPMPWDQYSELLDALAKAGIIELGYAGASKKKKQSCLRLPHVGKYGWTEKEFNKLPNEKLNAKSEFIYTKDSVKPNYPHINDFNKMKDNIAGLTKQMVAMKSQINGITNTLKAMNLTVKPELDTFDEEEL